MRLKDVIKKFDLQPVAGYKENDINVSGAYTSDLLSDVIANTKKENIWITMQIHVNIIAVANLKELSAIIVVMDKNVDKDTIERAEKENIPILKTELTAFQISGKLYEYGVR
jgi:serine kinase of HPr protein (carbohydrate metabolism regulator)